MPVLRSGASLSFCSRPPSGSRCWAPQLAFCESEVLSLGWRDTEYPGRTSGHKHCLLSEFFVQGPFSTGCTRWLLVALELCLKSSKMVFPQPSTPAEPPTHSSVARSCSGNICHMAEQLGSFSSDHASYVHMDCFWVQVAI